MTTLDEQRHVFERLKQAIKALEAKRACPYGHLSDYPPVIADCHKPMVQYAYNGERPIEADMPELDIIMMGTQLRTRGARRRLGEINLRRGRATKQSLVFRIVQTLRCAQTEQKRSNNDGNNHNNKK